MTISQTEIELKNERSQQTLVRAISLAKGQFSLILVLCNRAQLQRRVWERLQNDLPAVPKMLFLSEVVTSLYDTIDRAVGNVAPSALIVCGLESVKQIDDLLASSNRLRDRFPQKFAFPIVLFLNQKVLQKMVRVAHDFYSWAGSPIEFCSSNEELVDFLQSEAQILFDKVLEAGADRFLDNTALNFGIEAGRRFEIQIALQELARRGAWEVTLEANQKFILGRDAYSSGDLEQSRNLYEQSLALWSRCSNNPELLQNSSLSLESCWERQACLLFHLGLWWRRYASENFLSYQSSCQKAYDYYSQCLEVLKATNRPELIAKFINPLGEILQQLARWDELLLVAKKALQLHLMYPHAIRLARAYGFLAEVTLANSQWEEAKYYAEEALNHNKQSGIDSYFLTGLQQLHESRYLFQLAQAQRQLKQEKVAKDNLERAKDKCQPAFHPRLYINILEELRSLYFEDGRYLEAFYLKKEQRSIEQQYGFRGFIGAGLLEPQKQILHPALVSVSDSSLVQYKSINIAQEILSSGRSQHIEYLIERLQRNDYKLTIIYGPSGVGKSSLLNAGLIPALEGKTGIEGQKFLVLTVRIYQDWVQELGANMQKRLKGNRYAKVSPQSIPYSIESILHQLKLNAEHQLTTVLIFDQFEEFFFNCKYPQARKEFWEFLHQCLDNLDLPYVNAVISIRQDNLHYLLECDRQVNLEVTKNDILNLNNRHYFGNLSPEETKDFINSLAKNTYYLESELIQQLVTDLSKDTQEIRPIELQIVGSQLETENINSLVQYQEMGGKEPLIQRFLEDVIKDCGLENRKAAERILYLLTDENGTRPLRTKEHFKELGDIKIEQLNLILNILVKSGIVLLVTQDDVSLYQLVHDYLAAIIRQQIGRVLFKELEAEQNLRQQAEYILLILRSRLKIGVSILAVLGLVAVILARQLIVQRNQILREDTNRTEEIFKKSAFEALIEALRTGRRIQNTWFDRITIKPEIRRNAIASLKVAVNAVTENNRFNNEVVVNAAKFAPQQNSIATGSADGKIKFWNPSNQGIKTTQAHQRSVNSITFSPDGRLVASTGNEGVVKLWSVMNNNLIQQKEKSYLTGINSITFSSDNSTIASAGNDGTIYLWNWQTKATLPWKAHEVVVNALDFSPDGKMLASASADRTVKVWQPNGKLIKNLQDHTNWVTIVKFSPDGRYLASGSNDNTVKIWNLTLPNSKPRSLSHCAWVVTLDISPDSRHIAVGTADGSITLWNLQGEELKKPQECEGYIKKWQAHTGGVNNLNFNADGNWLVSAGNDNQVKMWRFGDLILPKHTNSNDLSELLALGCDKVKDYLKNQSAEDRTLCH